MYLKVKKISDFQSKGETMNVAIFKAYNQASEVENGKVKMRPATPFVSGSTVELGRTDQNKDDFISITLGIGLMLGIPRKIKMM